MMAGIKGKDTKPEMELRHALHASGFRYRLHVGNLPGTPDLVFPKFKAAIFVHGCFWHRHAACRLASTPATNAKFWQDKFDANVERDRRNLAALNNLGWRTAIVWECATRKMSKNQIVNSVGTWLYTKELNLALPY